MLIGKAFSQFNGEADSSFADNGVLLYDHLGLQQNEFLSKALFGPDGKLYLGGFIQGQNRDIFLVRLNPDGTPDTSFGNDGAVQFDPSLGGNDELADFAFTASGKIVIAGTTNAGNTDQIVAVFKTDGTLDETFAGTGYTTTGGPDLDTWMTVWVDEEDRIVLAGNTSGAGGQNLTIARANLDGSLDPTFGAGGFNIIHFEDTERFLDIHWHDFSKRYYLLALIDGLYHIMTFTEDGQVENDFSGDGLLDLNVFGSETETFTQIVTGPNGDIFVAGSVADAGNISDVLVLKIYNTGDPYLPFATNGYYRSNLGSGGSDYAANLHFLADGTLLVSGITDNSGKQNLMTFQLASDGSLVSNYGLAGVMEYSVQNEVDEFGGYLCLDGSGDVYISGTSVQPGHDDMVVAKLKTSISSAVRDITPSLKSLSVFPNPTNDQLTISFDLDEASEVEAQLYALTGEWVAALPGAFYPAGMQLTDGSNLVAGLPAGAYILRIIAKNQAYAVKISVH